MGVLVVDGDAAIREALERALRLEGFAVSAADGSSYPGRRTSSPPFRPEVISTQPSATIPVPTGTTRSF